MSAGQGSALRLWGQASCRRDPGPEPCPSLPWEAEAVVNEPSAFWETCRVSTCTLSQKPGTDRVWGGLPRACLMHPGLQLSSANAPQAASGADQVVSLFPQAWNLHFNNSSGDSGHTWRDAALVPSLVSQSLLASRMFCAACWLPGTPSPHFPTDFLPLTPLTLFSDHREP